MNIDLPLDKRKRIVRFNDGTEFESVAECARVLKKSPEWVRYHQRKGDAPFDKNDKILKKWKRGGISSKACFFKGKYYSSHGEAAEDNNCSESAVTQAIKRGSGSARDITKDEFENINRSSK